MSDEPIFGNSLSLIGTEILAGNSRFRVNDLARVGGASPLDGVACSALRGSTRWACIPGSGAGPAVSVIDTVTEALVEDGNVPVAGPLPGPIGAIRVVPGPPGQVALMAGSGHFMGDWLVLFVNPDFR